MMSRLYSVSSTVGPVCDILQSHRLRKTVVFALCHYLDFYYFIVKLDLNYVGLPVHLPPVLVARELGSWMWSATEGLCLTEWERWCWRRGCRYWKVRRWSALFSRMIWHEALRAFSWSVVMRSNPSDFHRQLSIPWVTTATLTVCSYACLSSDQPVAVTSWLPSSVRIQRTTILDWRWSGWFNLLSSGARLQCRFSAPSSNSPGFVLAVLVSSVWCSASVACTLIPAVYGFPSVQVASALCLPSVS